MATESMTRDGRRATLLAALAITVHVTGLLLPLHYQGFIGFGPIIPWQSGRPPSFTVGVLIAGLITVVVVAVGLWLLFRSQLSAAGGVFLAAAINELAGAVHAPLVVPGIQPFVRGGLRLVEGSLLLAATWMLARPKPEVPLPPPPARTSSSSASPPAQQHRLNVVLLAGTVAADPVQRRMPSGDEVTESQLRLSVPEAVLLTP